MSRWQEFLEKNPHAPQLRVGIERQVDFDRWGFRLAYAGTMPMTDVVLVYESSKCRMRFGFSRGQYTTGKDKVGEGMEDHVFYGYGRLHAPDTDDTLTIDGKKCVAWHHPALLLNYLEYRNGRASLDEIAAMPVVSPGKDKIAHEADPRGPSTRLEIWAARIAVTWERCAPELFELLDLRRPELWEGYRRFRQDLWEAIKSRKFATMGDRAQASIKLLSMVYDQEIA